MWDNPRDQLPSEADNYDAWCERCQRVHPYYTMTREKYDQMIADAAKEMADRIDRELMGDASSS